MEYDFERAAEARTRSPNIINAAGESFPLPSGTFDLILSHEVLEHVQDDTRAVREMVRVLRSPDPASGKALFSDPADASAARPSLADLQSQLDWLAVKLSTQEDAH